MSMTNSQRRDARARRSILAALSVREATAGELARRLGAPEGRVMELLLTMEAAGQVRQQRQRRYPTGPLVPVWYAGPDGGAA